MRVARFPAAGETVLADRLEEVAGGKGLNQAIAAAGRGPCAFVGAIGDDAAGRMLLDRLQRGGVDTTWVAWVSEPTGRAFIEVVPDGENRIVVAPLANGHLGADVVRDALDRLAPAVVLAQLEVPLEAVAAAAAWTAAHDARFVLNASPVAALPHDLLARCDPLVVNRVEASAMLPHGARPGEDVGASADRLAEQVTSVVVTDGP
ncbi:MAG: ribokinase, partial [Actinobacteria bacterium]|nr:ribokinase [Actinomycetota bacterium]